jgi:hypothetical protein
MQHHAHCPNENATTTSLVSFRSHFRAVKTFCKAVKTTKTLLDLLRPSLRATSRSSERPVLYYCNQRPETSRTLANNGSQNQAPAVRRRAISESRRGGRRSRYLRIGDLEFVELRVRATTATTQRSTATVSKLGEDGE